jgi:hypothetical protein
MKIRFARLAFAATLDDVISACALSVRNPILPTFSAIQVGTRMIGCHHGVVTNFWGLPLVPFRMYQMDDGTVEVTVSSESSRTPTRGARARQKEGERDRCVSRRSGCTCVPPVWYLTSSDSQRARPSASRVRGRLI